MVCMMVSHPNQCIERDNEIPIWLLVTWMKITGDLERMKQEEMLALP